MKNAALLLLLALLAVPGCARRYLITLSNGPAMIVRGRPRYDATNGCFVCTDAAGRLLVIPSGRVREIAPASMSRQVSTAPLTVSPRR